MSTNETQTTSVDQPNQLVFQVERERQHAGRYRLHAAGGVQHLQPQSLRRRMNISAERQGRHDIDFHRKNLPPGSLPRRKLEQFNGKNVEKGDDISWSVGVLPSRLTIRLHGQLPIGATLSTPDP
jgi:hypothetical protein